MRQHLLAPTPISGWVSQSVSQYIMFSDFGDSYRIYPACELVLKRQFKHIKLKVKMGELSSELLPIYKLNWAKKQTGWLCLKAILVVSLTTDLMAVCWSSGHTNCANLHILNKLCKSAHSKQIVQICTF